jgi:hypothetical protein
MLWHVQIVIGLAVYSACIPGIGGKEPPAKTKDKVELRWLEVKPAEGLTEDKGFQTSCDPKDIAYPHKKPALVLTAAEVAEARLTKHDFSGSGGPSELYSVTLNLTKKARDKLAATCVGDGPHSLTIGIDGKYWGSHRYEKDKNKPLIAPECRAETFTPSVGYFLSRPEAERLVDAFK